MDQGSSHEIVLRGILEGHTGWVTSISTSPAKEDTIISGSRDKSLIIWNITRDPERWGVPVRRLTGHSHFIQDLVISSDGQFALTGSWDATLRLWDLTKGKTTRRFVGHKKDVLSVAFSADNRQIVSGSRDKTLKLWNTLGECKYTIEEQGHTEWVSCVRFSPNPKNAMIISAGWDRLVKVWNLTNCKLLKNFTGHTGYINTVTIAPDGSLCASGGKDGIAKLWDLNDGKNLYSLDCGEIIHSLIFSPSRFWLCAATQAGIRIIDLEQKKQVADITKNIPDFNAKTTDPACLSIAWSANGDHLYAGFSDNVIRCFDVHSTQ